jgi:hypothetical protein
MGGGTVAGGMGGGEPTGGMGGGATGGMGSEPGGFDAGVEDDRNAVMPGNICDRLATIQCAGEAACCDNPGRNYATCKTTMKQGCDTELMADQIAAAPEASFDAAQARTVFTEIERRASECDPSIAAYGIAFDGLRSIFRGTRAPDTSCTPANPLDRAMAGAALTSCTNADMFACLPSAISWRCAPHAGANGPCFTDNNCNPGLYCDNPDLSVLGGDCLARKAVGASCSLPLECESLFCKGGKCVAADQQAAYCLNN